MTFHLTRSSVKIYSQAWRYITLIAVITFVSESASADPSFKRPKIIESGPYVNSEILANGKYHTIVPKGAVLAVPTNLTVRIVQKPIGDFLIWPQFLKKNYMWILKKEVTYNQASGKNPLRDDQMKRLRKCGRVVIAVMRNNPVSVHVPEPSKNKKQ